MTTDDKITDEKLQYDINREAAKKSALSSRNLINMNFLQVKKYYLLIKKEWQNMLSLHILHQEKLLKNKQKQLKSKGKKKQILKEIKAKDGDHEDNYKNGSMK